MTFDILKTVRHPIQKVLLVPLLAGTSILGFPHSASATPSIDVTAFYDLGVSFYGPGTSEPAPDIVEACGGDGCYGSVSVIHNFVGDITETASESGSAIFTNDESTPFLSGSDSSTGWVVEVGINDSPFNSGGPPIGLSIDNAGETASFSSVVSWDIAGDSVGCSILTSYGDVLSPLACGSVSPDSNQLSTSINYLPPYGSMEYDWSITITDSYTAPEPSTLAIFVPVILTLWDTARLPKAAPRPSIGERKHASFDLGNRAVEVVTIALVISGS